MQLKEILDRIEIPAFDDIPDREAMERMSAKKWRLPNTEIDFVLIEDGPRAGNYLISAETVDRLPEFYERVKHLPYKPGPAKELNDAYRAMSSDKECTIYDAFTSSPIGLDRIVPTRWMLSLPDWAKAASAVSRRGSGWASHSALLVAVFAFSDCIAWRTASPAAGEDGSGLFWPALVTPLARYSCGSVRHTAGLHGFAHQRNAADRDGIRADGCAVPQRRVAVVCRQRDDRRSDCRVRSI